MDILKNKVISAAQLFAAGIVPAILSACLSCGPVLDLRDFSDADLFPPVIEKIIATDEYNITLEFNEDVSLNRDVNISPELGTAIVTTGDSNLTLTFNKAQIAGTRYIIDAEVSDSTGNRMSFLIPFYGFNPNLPKLLINEFTTQGSSTHPDIVELLITDGGNLAGLWIVEGTTDYPEESISMPALEVETGDYLLIHFKPQGIDDEIDETGSLLDESAGYDASPVARDFWVPGGGGLSGNNGVIAIYSAPGGRIIDAVLYSNRTSSSDENYSGFGSSRMLDKAVQITTEGGWTGSGDNGSPIPEDGLNPDDSTATRSMCRLSEPEDTDSSADWHIVPTSGSTFGSLNTDAVYE
ncbi:MAG: Ig-like domain-containing protein [Spirochaetales bacterium]|uniref:Ig-like domain-containing protein n=1 Tax=Candidatus Thalassospirochaeta sargassi TaxID=3119039 RepID=A0AAJ1ILK7_9SPIO|nr:Ig-like domain-containing protein [Spirochaetales bacterium]